MSYFLVDQSELCATCNCNRIVKFPNGYVIHIPCASATGSYKGTIPNILQEGSCLTRLEALLDSALDAELGALELVGGGVLVLEDLEGLGDLGLDGGLGTTTELGGELGGGDLALNGVELSLKVLAGLVAGREVLVGVAVGLSVLDHVLDLVGRETANRVLDGDLGGLARGLVLGRNLKETVGVNLEGTEELGLATGHRGDARELELAEETVVLALGALTLVDGESDSGLVVLNGGEDTRLGGGDGGVAGNDNTEDVTLRKLAS